MPTEEERIQYKNDLVAKLEADYVKSRSERVFIGEGDTPEEAEAKVQQQMREMEAAVERDYDQALKTTDPNSLIGQIVRHFPPMSLGQFMTRITKPTYALNAVDDPAPAPNLVINEPMLQFFEYSHLPPPLQVISIEFGHLAQWIAEHLPRNPERTVALRKLLEAKDCAVRARLYKETK